MFPRGDSFLGDERYGNSKRPKRFFPPGLERLAAILSIVCVCLCVCFSFFHVYALYRPFFFFLTKGMFVAKWHYA